MPFMPMQEIWVVITIVVDPICGHLIRTCSSRKIKRGVIDWPLQKPVCNIYQGVVILSQIIWAKEIRERKNHVLQACGQFGGIGENKHVFTCGQIDRMGDKHGCTLARSVLLGKTKMSCVTSNLLEAPTMLGKVENITESLKRVNYKPQLFSSIW